MDILQLKKNLSSYKLTPDAELGFINLYQEFLKGADLSKANLKPVVSSELLKIDDLGMEGHKSNNLFNKIAFLKLNGGLGTTLGSAGPKSAIEIKDGNTFLDLIVQQIKIFNKTYDCDIPLLFMNSFHTHEQTKKIMAKYKSQINIEFLEQNKYLRLEKANLLPVSLDDNINPYYPPGHGEVFAVLKQSGMLEKLIDKGIEYIFISNVDNINGSLDERIISWLLKTKCEFLMEVTLRTRNDLKGGIVVKNGSKFNLLELSQIKDRSLFEKNAEMLIFNTNNLWVNLKALKEKITNKNWSLPIIVNPKKIAGKNIIQLETAMGASISNFANAQLLLVDRDRFLPVKNCDDLFLIESDLFKIEKGRLIKTTPQHRPLPLIHLGQFYKSLDDYLLRLPQIPDISELSLLTIVGDVSFSEKTKLKGNVIIVANGGQLKLPAGTLLDNQVISGAIQSADL